MTQIPTPAQALTDRDRGLADKALDSWGNWRGLHGSISLCNAVAAAILAAREEGRRESRLATLDAIRDPSETMVSDMLAETQFLPYRTPFDAMWRAMIDALKRELSPGPIGATPTLTGEGRQQTEDRLLRKQAPP